MSATFRHPSVVAATIALLTIGLAACTAAAPTPIYVYETPTPGASIAKSATPVASLPKLHTPAATSSASAPSLPPAAMQTTAGPSLSASPTPSPSPTSPAAMCSGTSDNLDFFVLAAHVLSFQTYCAVVPSGWWLNAGSYTQPSGGTLTVTYKSSGGGVFTINEGAFCKISVPACSPHTSVIGTGHFGDLSGALDGTTGGGFAIYVAPGTNVAYQATGSGMTQAAFTSMAAALTKVPKT